MTVTPLRIQRESSSFLVHFLYFEEIKEALGVTLLSVCLYVYPS
jgi:hypothetical protein